MRQQIVLSSIRNNMYLKPVSIYSFIELMHMQIFGFLLQGIENFHLLHFIPSLYNLAADALLLLNSAMNRYLSFYISLIKKFHFITMRLSAKWVGTVILYFFLIFQGKCLNLASPQFY